MRYVPPPNWPPPPDVLPPIDDWVAPPLWKPRAGGFPITPDGTGYLAPSPPGVERPARPEPTQQEQDDVHLRVVTRMLAMWARTVQRDAHSYYQAAVKTDWTDRAIEYMEDWSPTTEDLVLAMEDVWIRGYKLVMSVYQMERWERAHLRLTASVAPDDTGTAEDALIKALRNTIEHLDDTRFTEYSARRDPADGRRRASIEDLPGKELFLGFKDGFIDAAFGVVDLKSATDKARKYAHLDDEFADWEPSDIDFENMGYNDPE